MLNDCLPHGGCSTTTSRLSKPQLMLHPVEEKFASVLEEQEARSTHRSLGEKENMIHGLTRSQGGQTGGRDGEC